MRLDMLRHIFRKRVDFDCRDGILAHLLTFDKQTAEAEYLPVQSITFMPESSTLLPPDSWYSRLLMSSVVLLLQKAQSAYWLASIRRF